MKKNYVLIALFLLISLFIYLFYRTEKTVITELFISIISLPNFLDLRKTIVTALPLHERLVYSLPEGLWVFSITLTSNSLFIQIRRWHINLLFMPLFFAIGLELFQLLHLTNGRFDFWDIVFSVFFWVVATFLIKSEDKKQNILQPFTTRSYVCFFSYGIVYLAHVWR